MLYEDDRDPQGRNASTHAGHAGSGSAQLLILLVLGAGAACLIGLLLYPFLPAIVTSAVLAVLVYPGYRPFEKKVGHRNVAALIGTGVVFFLLLLPVLGLSLVLLDQIRSGVEWTAQAAAGALAPGGRLHGWAHAVALYLGVDETRVSQALEAQMQGLANRLAGRTLAFLSGIGGWLLQAGAALFTLYYLLRDADRLVRAVKWLIPLDAARSEQLVVRAREVTLATVYGNVVVAIVQGVLGGLAFWALGISAAALWGTVMGVLSLLPVVGPPLVWAPAAVILLVNDEVGRGIALLGVGGLVISTVDNLLRAVLVSNRAQLHPLVVFFSVLGGIFVFGAAGLFVGPVLFVVALTLLEMARMALEPAGGSRSSAAAGVLLGHRTESPPATRSVEPDPAETHERAPAGGG